MRFVIIGAGAVGGTIGGRLAESGREVVLVARGAHAAALRERGLRLHVPDRPGGPLTLRVPVAERPEEVALRPDDVLVLSVKLQHAVAALDAWAPRPVAGGGTAGEVLPLLCAQNGVAGEGMALRRFRSVFGVCVWLPCHFLEPGVITAPCAPLTGMLHLGRYPAGEDDAVRRVAAGLESSPYLRAPVVPDVMRWKYAKLLANLANAVEALGGPLGADPRLPEAARRARAEGEAVLAAAGIAAAGRDEQQRVRGDRVTPRPMPGAEGGGSSWQSLRRGAGSIEADYLNGEIVLLGRRHGVPTPVNETLQRLAGAFAREGRAPGSLPPGELLTLLGGEDAR
jgi:2-dehydropantoate 2-reductase